jgi:hypothetical protein
LDTFIFRILFEIIPRRDTTLTLNIEPTSKSSNKQLLYEHGTVIGQGEYSLMVSLKESLEELVRDDSLRARIREYEEFKGKLQNNPQYARLRFIATVMRDEIHGGAILGGYPACNLCDPDIPFHLDQPANVTTELSNRDKEPEVLNV